MYNTSCVFFRKCSFRPSTTTLYYSITSFFHIHISSLNKKLEYLFQVTLYNFIIDCFPTCMYKFLVDRKALVYKIYEWE